MMYSSLRHETRTRDLLNIIIRTARFVVCALMKCLCVATLWIKNDPTKDQTNTALGAAQSPFCSEDSKPQRQCEGERGQAGCAAWGFILGNEICTEIWHHIRVSMSVGMFLSPSITVRRHQTRRQTKQNTTLKSWLILSTIRCSVTMIQIRNTGVQLTAESGRRNHSDDSYCTRGFTAGLLVERMTSSLCSDRRRHHFYSAQFRSVSC